MVHHILSIALLLSLSQAVFGAAIFGRNSSLPYVLKKTWVENFIKFQYIFQGKNATAKIVPLGCVPTNQDNGNVLKVGETFSDKDFVYACVESEDGIISYEAIACVDGNGRRMQLGELRKLSNGTVILHCNLYGGALKKVVERAAGCYFNETIYGEDEIWIEPLNYDKTSKTFRKKIKPIEAKLNKSTSQLSGRLMECFRPHFSYYESHVIGCAIRNIGIRFDDVVELSGGKRVRCVQDDDGNLKLEDVELDELSCTLDNETFAHLSKWTDYARAAEMLCLYGHLKKTGCFYDGQSLPISQEVQLSNGCVFMCHPQSNVYICNERLGNWTIEGDVNVKIENL